MKYFFIPLVRTLRSIPCLGISGSIKFLLSNFFRGEYAIRPKFCRHPLIVRGKHADVLLFYQIFCRNLYAIPSDENFEYVIDGGANVGYASVYFASKLPNAQISAIEMESSNFKQLVKNAEKYPNIRPMHAALWPRKEKLQIANPDAEAWSFRCEQVNGTETSMTSITAITVEEVMTAENIESVDLFKIDIEGAEKELFSAETPWLSSVRYMYLEIHKGCWKAVFDRLCQYSYDARISGENILLKFDKLKNSDT